MDLSNADPFWSRMGLTRNVVAAWLLPAAVLATLAWALAVASHSAADAWARGMGGDGIGSIYPVEGHAIGVTLLGAVAVGVATTLVRAGSSMAAGVVLLAAAAGPMTVLASPVRISLVDDQGGAVLWWRISVGAIALALLVGWTALLMVVLRGRPLVGSVRGAHARAFDLAVLAVLAAGAYSICLNASWEAAAPPTTLTNVGWAVVAAGVALAFCYGPWWARVTNVVGTAGALGVMALSYHRGNGEYPGVAGWEYATSPIVFSGAVAGLVLLAGPVGATIGLARTFALRARFRTSAPLSGAGV